MRGLRSGALVVLSSFFVPHSARADEPCPVRLVDGRGAHSWERAVAAASRAVAEASGDCADISVTPEREGAMVSFTTRDGRVARRHIRWPADLGPLVDALTVTMPSVVGPPAPPPEALVTETSPEASTSAPVPERTVDLGPELPPAADRATDAAPRPVSFVVFAGGGARTSGRTDVVTPQGQLGLGVVYRGWQLDVVGRLEAEHDVGPETRLHGELSSLGGGVRASRRTSVGSFVIVSGVSLALQYASLESRRAERHIERDWLEPRAGAFFGVVGPRIGRFRIRGEILGEVALASGDPTAALPATAGLGVGGMIGVETSFLP